VSDCDTIVVSNVFVEYWGRWACTSDGVAEATRMGAIERTMTLRTDRDTMNYDDISMTGN
jgi:hypothetical protein